MDDADHLLKQAACGEFALRNSEARQISAEQFAQRTGSTVKRSQSGVYDVVAFDGCEYMWSAKTGKYDGWGRSMM